MTNQAERLLSEFPEHTYDQWHEAAEKLLKGAPFEKVLVSKTYEDITIQPIYRQEDIKDLEHLKQFPGADSLVRGSKANGFLAAGWEISQELKASTPEALNTIIHEGLNGGQTELNIGINPGCPHCPGFTPETVADIKTALDGVAVDAISTYFSSGSKSLSTAALFFAAAKDMGVDISKVRVAFDDDPLATLVFKGQLKEDLGKRYDQMAALTAWAIKNAPAAQTITVQGDIYHNAGATATQELGYILATLVTYLEEMKARGLCPSEVLPRVRIRVAIGSDYFMEIAKIRATRWLWSKVAAAYGAEDAPIHIHASTSKWNKTSYDAHTNMLRVTSEAFAGVVAGVDGMHIGPYDEIAGESSEFSRRLARNRPIILREECGLDQVIDPAGGSSYIEWLTDQVAAKSWEIFQGIESSGGMLEALKAGTVQDSVEAVAKAKFTDIRRRKYRIVGGNMYPDLKGKKLEPKAVECAPTEKPAVEAASITPSADAAMVEQAIAFAASGTTASAIAAACESEGTLEIKPLATRRAVEEYEALREASAAFAGKTGAAPAIIQLNMGPSRRYRLRADWTASFFEAAGFNVEGATDFDDVDAAVAALANSKAAIAVITSDDDTYQEVVAPLAKAVKALKPAISLLVAGAPGENEAAWRDAGVDDFVNIRSNNYELNEQLLKKTGVL
ncbi:MAG: methylmalonyl-CoA mutase family protein [Verrucomicrobiales bacterium]